MARPFCSFVRPCLTLLASALILGLTIPAVAQPSVGSIAGAVTDPLGGRVSGAVVKLLHDGV
ncbi:MAG: hypothetical protein ACREA0_34780, partial [bacterium]